MNSILQAFNNLMLLILSILAILGIFSERAERKEVRQFLTSNNIAAYVIENDNPILKWNSDIVTNVPNSEFTKKWSRK